MKFKYIIVELDEMELPLIFSPFLSHGDISITRGNSVKSAGYCELDGAGKWITSGQSVSLQLNARPQDSDILNTQGDCSDRLTGFDVK